MKIVSDFGQQECTKSSVFRDLLKVCGFYKIFWIAKNVRDAVNLKTLYFSYSFY